MNIMITNVHKKLKTLNQPFYLTGGTAVSRGYLHHRYSDDLDLCCITFRKREVVLLRNIKTEKKINVNANM